MAGEHSNRGAKRAREARVDLGLGGEAPLDDLLLAVEDGGGAQVLIMELPDGVAGAYIANRRCPLLFVNGRQAISRQRFTLAHEFGHFRAGHTTVIDQQEAISGGHGHDPQEVCANAFAAEFLMPREGVRVWGAQNVDGPVSLEHVLLMACAFGVSAQASRYALESAGVLSDRERAQQLDAEIAEELHVEGAERLGLQWRHDELADAAGRLPRIPAGLRDTGIGDLLAGRIDAEELARRSGRTCDEVVAMLQQLRIDELVPTAIGSAEAS